MKAFKLNRFCIDTNLGYLIQQVTSDSTEEILTYFYGITSFVIDDILKNSKAHRISKDVVLFYKETPVSYRINIVGSSPSSDLPRVYVTITTPKNLEQQDVSQLMNSIVESGLGLSEPEETLEKFRRPELKTPRCLRSVRIAQYEQRSK